MTVSIQCGYFFLNKFLIGLSLFSSGGSFLPFLTLSVSSQVTLNLFVPVAAGFCAAVVSFLYQPYSSFRMVRRDCFSFLISFLTWLPAAFTSYPTLTLSPLSSILRRSEVRPRPSSLTAPNYVVLGLGFGIFLLRISERSIFT